MIPLAECKHGVLYRVAARNFSLSVFDRGLLGFHGLRLKFGTWFVDTETHYEANARGTASPTQELPERMPHVGDMRDPIVVLWLGDMNDKYGEPHPGAESNQ